LEQLGFEFKVTADNLRKELEGIIHFSLNLLTCFNMIERNGSATLSQLETATTNLSSTRMELSSTKSAVADLTTQLNGKI
jgi:hypothetical protein